MANSSGISRARIRACLTVLICLFGPVLARADGDIVLRPVDAHYRVLISGVPVGMEARIAVQRHPVADSAFDILFAAEHALLHHEETSSFLWNRCQAKPYEYRYLSSGFGIRRGGQVLFDWPRLLAAGTDDVYAIPEDTVDAISLAMMARCRLARGEETFEFHVAEPQGLRLFRFRVVAREQLKTPAGTFDTIKVERLYDERGRRTYMWAAPALEYFMIRMEHIENPLLRGRIELTGIDWPADDPDQGNSQERVHAVAD